MLILGRKRKCKASSLAKCWVMEMLIFSVNIVIIVLSNVNNILIKFLQKGLLYTRYKRTYAAFE
jgi:hypothetical protein